MNIREGKHMPEKRIIIYGLGKSYEIEKEWITRNFDNTLFSDIDISYKDKFDNRFIAPSDINNLEYERIIVTSRNYFREIVAYLKSLGISEDHIFTIQGEKCRINAERNKSLFNSFAERGEDYVIYSLLCEGGFNIENVKYIDIGVNDPIFGSNTYALYLRGARGVCIDADPRVIDVVKADRKGDVVRHNAVTDDAAISRIPFYMATSTALSSCIRDNVEQWEGIEIEEEIEVESITVNDVFYEYGDETGVLSLDVEGLDRRILFSLDFERFSPYLICSEIGVPDEDLMNYMKMKGYSLRFNNRVNGIWTRD